MEMRDIIVEECHHHPRLAEWQAAGCAERYGASVRWSAVRADDEPRWSVHVESVALDAMRDNLDLELVCEGGPTVADDVNSRLRSELDRLNAPKESPFIPMFTQSELTWH
jgi:hypothetical protein